MLTRKDFLRASIVAAAGLPLIRCGNDKPESSTLEAPEVASTAEPLPFLDTIGLQLWTVRDQLLVDPRGTLKILADLGYRQVELMDTRAAAEQVPLAREFGMKVNSSFMNWNTVTGNWQFTPDDTPFEFSEVLDHAGNHGLSHLVFGYLRPEERTSADDWRKHADDINEAALKAKENGLQMAYHNHNFEWDPMDGTTGWAILNERLDGDLVPFELDVFWAEIAGQDARQTMEGIADRLELLHLKQLNPSAAKVTRIDAVDGNAYEELPDGNIPIKELMRYGKELGVKYCMVEQDGNYDKSSLNSVERSLEYLRS